MLDDPKLLEIDFNKLCINPNRKSRMRSKSFTISTHPVKKKYFTVPSRQCYGKVTKTPPKNAFVRPAEFNFYKKSTVRSAKLNLKNSKLFLLKPPTLILPEDKDKRRKVSTFTAPSRKKLAIPISNGKDKTVSHNSFKTLSFKKLRSPPSNPSSDLSGISVANKRENASNSSCSVQAQMESSVPVDCDDTSIEELASYFDLFVHIPKKMSSMAEMMYI